jgi:membrane protease YdiL (CAAX protease family)
VKFDLSEPRMVAEAREQIRWKHNFARPLELAIEVLLFTLVFLIAGSVFSGVFLAIGLIPLIATNREFLDLVASATVSGDTSIDLETSTELTNQIMQEPAMTVVALFATLGTIVGVIIYCRGIEGRRLATLGLRRGHALREYLVGMLVGLLLFGLVMLICVVTGALSYQGFAFGSIGLLIAFLLAFMVQGLSEELLCRGYFMVSLARKQSLPVALIISSCLFAILHLANAGIQPLAFVNLVLFGCLTGVYLLKRGSIWGVAALHSLWNFAQGSIFGIPVSGIETAVSVVNFAPVTGGELINGGAFGVEGGLATTIVLAAALIVTLLLKARETTPWILPTADGSAQVVVLPGARPLPR